MRNFLQYLPRTAEYGLAVLFIFAGVNTIFASPIPHTSVFYNIVAAQAAIYVYAVMFLAVGFTLIYAKVNRERKLHGYCLLTMYLMCLYAILLSFGITGVTFTVVPATIAGILSGTLWLRWKMKIDYI